MSIGFPEMLVIFGLALLMFGPRKLPEIGRMIGKALNEFRRAADEFKSTLEREVDLDGTGSTGNLVKEFKEIKDEVSQVTSRINDFKQTGRRLLEETGTGITELSGTAAPAPDPYLEVPPYDERGGTAVPSAGPETGPPERSAQTAGEPARHRIVDSGPASAVPESGRSTGPGLDGSAPASGSADGSIQAETRRKTIRRKVSLQPATGHDADLLEDVAPRPAGGEAIPPEEPVRSVPPPADPSLKG